MCVFKGKCVVVHHPTPYTLKRKQSVPTCLCCHFHRHVFILKRLRYHVIIGILRLQIFEDVSRSLNIAQRLYVLASAGWTSVCLPLDGSGTELTGVPRTNLKPKL